MFLLIIGIVVYVLGSAIDVYTTKRALEDGRLHLREKNPLAAWVYRLAGWYGLVALKLAILGAAIAARGPLGDGPSGGILIGAGVIFAVVGWRNRQLIHEARDR